MDTRTEVAHSKARLNPFAFPSNTDFRFFLLIVAVLSVALNLYSELWFVIPGNQARYAAILDACARAAESAPESATNNAGGEDVIGVLEAEEVLANGFDAIAANSNARLLCRADIEIETALWDIIGIFGLFVVALAIYFTYPYRRMWRGGFERFAERDGPNLLDYVKALCREAGLKTNPTLVWNSLDATKTGGQVFGTLGHYYLAISGGLFTRFHKDRAAFRSAILHELAHLRNGDVDKTYFALAIWEAFVVAGLLPLLIGVLIAFDAGRLGEYVWRTLILASFVYLIRNAVLRSRELYADLRASTWDGRGGALSRVLAELTGHGGLKYLLEVHPLPETRRKVLENTDSLFDLNKSDAFAVGMITGIALPIVVFWVSVITTPFVYTRGGVLTSIIPGLIFAPFVVGVVGMGIWRMTFARLMRRGRVAGAGRCGIALGLGLLLGRLVSYDSIGIASEFYSLFNMAPSPINILLGLTVHLLWDVLFLIGMFLLVRWIAAGVDAWYEVLSTARSPRAVYLAALVFPAVLLGIILGVFFVSRDLLVTLSALGEDPVISLLILGSVIGAMIIAVLGNPLTLLAGICLWIFPLAASFWRRRPAGPAPAWIYLDAVGQRASGPAMPRFRIGMATTAGILSGMIYAAIIFVVWFIWRQIFPDHTPDELKLAFIAGLVVLAALIQTLVAMTFAATVKRVGSLHGLFAAFVGGSLMAPAILGTNLVFGGSIEPAFAWQIYGLVVNSGALVGLPAALIAGGIAGWVRRRDRVRRPTALAYQA